MRMSTELTRLLGTARPVLPAPTADPAVVLAFSRGGGLGVLAAGPGLPAAVRLLLNAGLPFAVQVGRVMDPRTAAALRAVRVPVLIGPAGGSVPAGIVLARVDGVEAAGDAVRAGARAVIVPGGTGMAEAVATAWPALPVIVDGPATNEEDMGQGLDRGAAGLQLGASATLAQAESAGRPQSERQAREAAALRQNLVRRKSQQRDRPPS